MINENETDERTLNINCGLACLLKDREGMLDKYDWICINSGTLVVSEEMNAALAEKKAVLNVGNIQVKNIKGDIIQLDAGSFIDGKTSYKGFVVFSMDDLVIQGDGAQSFSEAEGIIVLDTLYYPESGNTSFLSKVQGKLRAYPGDAHPVLGSHDLEKLITGVPADTKHIWVTGKVSALDKKVLARFQASKRSITCQSLFTYESFNDTYGSLFSTTERILVPDGHAITGNLRLGSAEAALYGPKIYVNGDLTMDEKDAPCLEELESIVVKGKASLNASCVKSFRKIGKAADYFIYEGHLYTANGFEQFTHEQLQTMVEQGTRITITVNGCLLFTDDVTAEDIEAIAAIFYNGSVLIPGKAKGALSSKVKQGNGFMGDSVAIQKLTGKSIEEIIKHYTGGGEGSVSTTNVGAFILI